MVVTKSISRFARNTLDCLKYIRQKITVFDDHLAFEFKSGLETEVQM